MPLYSPAEITNILTKAYTTLYELGAKAERERFIKAEGVLYNEVAIIYDLTEAVERGNSLFYTQDSFHRLAGYLLYKCSSYGFNGINPFFSPVIPDDTPVPPTPGTGDWLLLTQFAPTEGQTIYSSASLIGRNVVVFLDGQKLGTGFPDRQGYSYDILTGTITFNSPLSSFSVVAIYTYTVGAAGWVLSDSFVVGDPGELPNGSTVYTDAALIGEAIVVFVDGLRVSADVIGSFSYSFNALTGTITFNTPLTTGQLVEIYIY